MRKAIPGSIPTPTTARILLFSRLNLFYPYHRQAEKKKPILPTYSARSPAFGTIGFFNRRIRKMVDISRES